MAEIRASTVASSLPAGYDTVMIQRLRMLLAAGLLGCASTTRQTDPYAFSQEALQATERHKGSLAPGSDREREAVERFKGLFADFTPEGVRAKARATYAQDAYFHDTLRSIRGVDQIETYLAHSAEAVESCKVEPLDVVSKDGEYYFRWAMHMRLKKLQKGKTLSSTGISHVRFDKDGKVVFHQDYWDAASYFFEKVPIVGGGIRFIKRRL